MLYCLNPTCPNPSNPDGNIHCQNCGVRLALRDRFKGLHMIGQGGFGKTYLAQDLDNRNKPCVIKRLTYQGPTPQATEKARQLFEQEAERLDHLIHPQIPRLIAYFQENDYLYLVQEFVEGETLHSELHRHGCMNETKVRAVLQGLLPILKFVHSRNVIHRDLKPDNIIRRRDGALILIDFGVAKLLEQSGVQSATTIGTPGYAAPEQVQGRATPASDLFALGATCFQLLTQGFENGMVSKSGYSWVDQWQTYLPKANSHISPQLTAILSRLISLDEYQRYRSADDVLQALTAPSPTTTAETIAPKGPQPHPSASEIATIAMAPQPPAPHSVPAPNRAPNPALAKPAAATPPSPSAPAAATPPAPATPPAQSGLPPTVVSARPQPLAGQPPAARPAAGEAPVLKPYTVPIGGGFWLKYGCFTYLGQALGFFLAMVVTAKFALSASADVDSQMDAILKLLYWLYWPVAGFAVGIMQWLALKKWLPRALWWWPATVAGFWAIALATATGYTNLPSSLAVGGFIGATQWGAMRQQAPRAGWWVLWCTVLTAVLFRAIAPSNILRILGWVILAPLLDGLFLTWILRRQQSRSAQ